MTPASAAHRHRHRPTCAPREIGEYADYLPLTIRQIFYRLVGAFDCPKTEQAYARLCEYLNRARRARTIDFEDIRDDGVTIMAQRWFADPADFWDDTADRMNDYERDKQVGQRHYVELWCEAQGMMPQLARVAEAREGFQALPDGASSGSSCSRSRLASGSRLRWRNGV